MTLSSRPVRAFTFTPVLPGDKSITHRAFLLGALAGGDTEVAGANGGADCRATLNALGRLGASWEEAAGTFRITGTHGRFRDPEAVLDLGNSGTGLRLLMGVLASQSFPAVLTGDASLQGRPVERVLTPLRLMGVSAAAAGDHPPVTLEGGRLRGITYRMPVPSAQVLSALLLAGLRAEGTTRVEGIRGARDHTQRMLQAFGARLREEEDAVEIKGPQPLTGTAVRVPGDASAAMFYLTAAAIVPGSHVTVEDVGLNPTRINGFTMLKNMGLDLTVEAGPVSGGEPRGRVTARGGSLANGEVAAAAAAGMIDELPVLAVAAAFAAGETVIRGAGELRHKESDRLAAVAEGLAAIGAGVVATQDGWRIRGSGGAPLAGGAVASGGDHRVAMAFLVAGLRCRNGVTLTDAGGIETSDPGFLANLNRLLAGGA